MYFLASFIKLMAIITITAQIGNAATILTDWRLFMKLSANSKAIGSRISKIKDIQIVAAIYTQARLRTSLFCFLLYQLSLWWVKYRAQPEAISTWNHTGRNAPWQAETGWGEKVKPRKPAWNQDFFWLSICGCQVRNKKIYKKISPTRVSVGSEPIWAL